MFNSKDISILAPYGSMKFSALATKVSGKVPAGIVSSLAPYGSMEFIQLATKVGITKVPPGDK